MWLPRRWMHKGSIKNLGNIILSCFGGCWNGWSHLCRPGQRDRMGGNDGRRTWIRIEGDSRQKSILCSSNMSLKKVEFGGRYLILIVLLRNHCKLFLPKARANPHHTGATYNNFSLSLFRTTRQIVLIILIAVQSCMCLWPFWPEPGLSRFFYIFGAIYP